MERIRAGLKPEFIIAAAGLVVITMVAYTMTSGQNAFDRILSQGDLSSAAQQSILLERAQLAGNSLAVILFVLAMFIGLLLLLLRNRRIEDAHNQALEHQVQERTAQLAHERNLLRTVLDTVPDLVYSKDRGSRFTLANLPVAQYYKVAKPEDLIGKSDINFAPPELAQQYAADEQRLFETGEPLLDHVEQIFNQTRNEFRWVSANKVPLRDEDHNIIGLVGVNHDITDAKRTQAELKEGEEKYRRIIENVQEGILTTNSENEILYINPVGAQIHGHTPKEMLGHLPSEYLADEEQRRQSRERFRSRRAGKMTAIEVAIRRPDGSIAWIRSLANPIFDESGTFTGSLYTFTDVTERRVAEKAAAYERELLQALMDNIPDLIFFKDPESRFVRSNAAHLRALGAQTQQEIIGKSDLDYHEPNAARGFMRDEKQIIETGVPLLNQVEINPAPDGTARWFSTTKVPWRDTDGNIIGTLGVAHNITELKKKDEQLEASESLYRSLVQVMPQSVFRKDREGRFTFGNARFFTSMGHSPDEVIGKTDYDFFPKEIGDEYRATDRKVMASGEPYEVVEEFTRPDGKTQTIRTIKSPVYDANGTVTGVQVMFWDITEGRRQHDQIRKLSRALEQSSNSVFIMDAQRHIEYVNPAFMQVTGYTLEEALGKSPRELKGGDESAEQYQEIRRKLDAGLPWRGELQSHKKNGELYWELSSISPIADDEGRVTHFVAVEEDITERKQMDEQLRERQELLSRILDTVADGIYIIDQNGKMSFANSTTERMLGATRAEIARASYKDDRWKMTSLDGKPFLEADQPYERVMSTGLPVYDVEQSILRPDGTRVIVSINAAPLHDADGKIIGEVGSMTDITERKRAEQALQESEERFRQLFEASPDAIVLVDPHDAEQNWAIIDCNEVACRMNGYTHAEMVGQPIDMLNSAPSTPARQMEYLELVRSSGVLHVEAEHRHADGHIFPIEISTTLITLGGRELVLGIDRDITERKRVEQALHENEEKFRQLFEASPDAILLMDPHTQSGDWTIVGCNRAACEMNGYSHDEMIGARIGLLDPEGHSSGVGPHVLEHVREQGIWHHESIHRHKDGHLFPIEVSNSVIVVGGRELVLGIDRDITERKRTEAALRESERMLAKAQEIAHIGSWRWNLRTDELEWSDEMFRIYGVERTGFAGTVAGLDGGFVFSEDRAKTNARIDTAKREGVMYPIEYRALRPDGQIRSLWSEGEVTRDDAGNVIGLIGVVQDITERKLAEQELTKQKELLQAIFDHIPVMIGVFDSRGHFTLINNEWEQTLGYNLEEMSASDVMQVLYPEREQRVSMQDFMFAPTPGWRDFNTVVRDGYSLDTSWAYARLSDGTTIAFGQDITKRKEVDRLKNEFISTVSHELRTPLTSIRGSLGLISGGVAGPIPDRARGMIDIAYKNSERLVRLINDILDIEKIESGKMVFNFKPIDLMTLVEQAMEANRGFGEQYQVAFIITDKAAGVEINADWDRMTQVMTNLLSNAAKFSPAGDNVEVSVRRVPGGVRVAVHDWGKGIPEEFRDRLFQKFAQADSSDSRQKGGTGLGLSIAKAIVEKHDGTIGFETAEGWGTTFYFELPERRAEPSLPMAGFQNGNNEPREPRILIIEDDHDVALLLNLMLKHGGFATDVAYDAAQAQELLKEKKYTAITLDLMLPDKDGIMLIRELRQDESTRDLPIIVVSAKAEQGRQQLNGNAVWVADWLQKPIDQQQLVRAVKDAALRVKQGKPRILHIEDDPDVLRVVEAILQETAEVTPARSLTTARELLEHNAYDLVLLDSALPDGSGSELFSVLQQREGHVPVVIFSAREEDMHSMRDVSAALVKSRTSNEELLNTITDLIRKHEPAPVRVK